MDVEPAHISQIRQAADGRFVEISAEASTVVADLKKIDKNLGVRFAENGNPPYWHVYVVEEEGGRTTHRLVLSQQATQNQSGVWEGLDQRIVRRVMKIGHSTYDFAKEVERQNARAEKDKQHAKEERMGELGEQAAHAIRKDLGVKYQGRIFKPRDI